MPPDCWLWRWVSRFFFLKVYNTITLEKYICISSLPKVQARVSCLERLNLIILNFLNKHKLPPCKRSDNLTLKKLWSETVSSVTINKKEPTHYGNYYFTISSTSKIWNIGISACVIKYVDIHSTVHLISMPHLAKENV